MNMTRLAVITTFLAAATSGAFAQGSVDRAEEMRRDSEMMKPPTLGTGQQRLRAPAPMSEADRKAEEFRKSTEMMRPQTYGSQAPASRVTGLSPVSDADRRVAETMQRTEQMKPN